MSTEMITLRVTPEQKAKLESLAKQQGCSVSDVIRRWIDDSDSMNDIPPDLMKQLQAEAKRRGIPTADLMSWLVVAGFGKLRKNTSTTVFVLD